MRDLGLATAGRRPRSGGDDVAGRETEFHQWHGCLHRLSVASRGEGSDGAGGAVALVGEPGIGKTTLVTALSSRAQAAGVPVLAGYGDMDAGLLPRTGEASGAGGVLVTWDDLHLAGPASLPLLEELLWLTTNSSVLLLLAYRERQLTPGLAAMLSRAGATDLLRRWRIGPLSLTQTRQLLGDVPNLAAIHEQGRGNPLYMKVIASAEAEDADADADTALLGELAGLTDAALRVANAAAVLGDPFDPELLAAVAGLPAPQALEALDGLTRLDLIRPVPPPPLLAFRHPVIGQLLYRRLEPGRRLSAHLLAEAELTRRDAPLALRAYHVARAAHASRPDHTTTLLAAAAEAIHTAPATAAEWLEVALRLVSPQDERWLPAQVLFARAKMLSGHPSDSRDLLHALLPRVGQTTPDQFASTVAFAGRSERLLSRYIEAAALMRQGLSVHSGLDARIVVGLLTELADVAIDRRDDRAARQYADEAVTRARACGDRPGEASAWALLAKTHELTADLPAAQAAAGAAADIVDATSDAELLTNLPSLHLVGMAESALELISDAQRHLNRAAVLSRRTGQTFILPAVLKTLGECELRLGHLRQAHTALEQAQVAADQDGGPATRAIVLALRALTALWLRGPGSVGEALSLSERAVSLADGLDWGWTVHVRCYHAEVLIHSGQAARSQQVILDAVGGPQMPRLPVWRRARSSEMLTQAALAEADLAAARRWSELAATALESRPSSAGHGVAHRARMRWLGARGDVHGAIRAADTAIESFMERGFAMEVGRTAAAVAIVLLNNGHTDGVDDWLARAGAVAQRCGSDRLADEVARQSARLASSPQPALVASADPSMATGPLAALTEREREIAALTSTGLTSVGIARELTLSVRTVDTHLGRIYRKLGLSNRAGLTRAMLGRPRGSDPGLAPLGFT